MILADFIAIAILVFASLMGYFIGFGKGLKNVTSGIIGFIISIIASWFIYGIILNLAIVQNWLNLLMQTLKDNGSGICNFLISIRIDLIVCFVAVLIIIEIVRIIIMKLICIIFEADNIVISMINKILGIILFIIYFSALVLIILQICFMIWGGEGIVYEFLNGSTFKLDKLYLQNPLNSFIETIRNTIGI